jgi:hypothetical protein
MAGTYSVTISDDNGCTATSSATVTEPTALLASSVVDSNATCNGAMDGGVSASASGGTAPYAYLWSNSATTASITGLMAGTYSVTITDDNGCTATSSATVTEPTALLASSVVDSNVTCNGAMDGGVSSSANGGTAPYAYLWSNSATTASITGLMAGTYSVTISDDNGCTATSSATVTSPAAIITTVTQAGPSLTADQAGATYQWLDCNNNNAPISGATNQTYIATANGDYAVEINLSGCLDTSACINVVSVGLNAPEQTKVDFKVYPNPTKGGITIAIQGNTFNQERLRIFDMSGKIVRDVLVNGNFLEVDLHGLNSGVYFLDLAGAKRKVILTD